MASKAVPVLKFLILAVLFAGLLVLGFKGKPAQPVAFQNDHDTSFPGPFEASNSTSRYALTEAIVENRSFNLTLAQARFAAPDLVYFDNKFQTIFTPGISFIGVPFYLLGKSVGLPQIGTFASTIVLALINAYLIYVLARKLGSSSPAAVLAAFVFLFATNAYTYAMSFTQHHGSIMVILLGTILALDRFTWKRALLFGVITGVGLLFDFPNLLLLFPIGLYLLSKAIFITPKTNSLILGLHPQIVGILLGMIPLLFVFGWYNNQVAGSPMRIGQFLGRTNYFDTEQKRLADKLMSEEDAKNPYRPRLPFQTRLQNEGIYILLFSQQRSWLFYSPVILLGLLGLITLYRRPETQTAAILVISVIVVNILVYSTFGDPWGGWAFGPRYLLPGAALLAVGLAATLTFWRRWWLMFIFMALTGYSLVVSVAGALTSATIPPLQEAKALSVPIPYTYTYNFLLLNQNRLGSLIYNFWAKNWFESGFGYFYAVLGLNLAIFLGLMVWYCWPFTWPQSFRALLIKARTPKKRLRKKVSRKTK